MKYFTLAVGLLSIIFSYSMGEMLKNAKLQRDILGVYVRTEYFRSEQLLFIYLYI